MSDTSFIKGLRDRIAELEKENKELKEWKENLIRADKKKTEHIDKLEEENKKLKEYWSIEINTCNRYREKSEQLEEENKELNLQIAELMGQRDGKQMKIDRLEKRIKEHVPTQILADFRNRFKD